MRAADLGTAGGRLIWSVGDSVSGSALTLGNRFSDNGILKLTLVILPVVAQLTEHDLRMKGVNHLLTPHMTLQIGFSGAIGNWRPVALVKPAQWFRRTLLTEMALDR